MNKGFLAFLAVVAVVAVIAVVVVVAFVGRPGEEDGTADDQRADQTTAASDAEATDASPPADESDTGPAPSPESADANQGDAPAARDETGSAAAGLDETESEPEQTATETGAPERPAVAGQPSAPDTAATDAPDTAADPGSETPVPGDEERDERAGADRLPPIVVPESAPEVSAEAPAVDQTGAEDAATGPPPLADPVTITGDGERDHPETGTTDTAEIASAPPVTGPAVEADGSVAPPVTGPRRQQQAAVASGPDAVAQDDSLLVREQPAGPDAVGSGAQTTTGPAQPAAPRDEATGTSVEDGRTAASALDPDDITRPVDEVTGAATAALDEAADAAAAVSDEATDAITQATGDTVEALGEAGSAVATSTSEALEDVVAAVDEALDGPADGDMADAEVVEQAVPSDQPAADETDAGVAAVIDPDHIIEPEDEGTGVATAAPDEAEDAATDSVVAAPDALDGPAHGDRADADAAGPAVPSEQPAADETDSGVAAAIDPDDNTEPEGEVAGTAAVAPDEAGDEATDAVVAVEDALDRPAHGDRADADAAGPAVSSEQPAADETDAGVAAATDPDHITEPEDEGTGVATAAPDGAEDAATDSVVAAPDALDGPAHGDRADADAAGPAVPSEQPAADETDAGVAAAIDPDDNTEPEGEVAETATAALDEAGNGAAAASAAQAMDSAAAALSEAGSAIAASASEALEDAVAAAEDSLEAPNRTDAGESETAEPVRPEAPAEQMAAQDDEGDAARPIGDVAVLDSTTAARDDPQDGADPAPNESAASQAEAPETESRESGDEQPVEVTSQSSDADEPVTTASADILDRPSNTAATTPESATARPEDERAAPGRSIGPDRANTTGGPTFDVIRVAGDGRTILAGKAEPLATVTIMDGEKALGEAYADTRGEWIFMPAEPLGAGNHQIGASYTRPGGEEVLSTDLILVVVPERGTDIAGRESDRADQPLVMLVPRDGGPATVVVQAPDPDAPLDEGLDGARVATADDGEHDADEGGSSVLFSRPTLPDMDDADPGATRTSSDERADDAEPDASEPEQVAASDAGPVDQQSEPANSGGDPATTEEDTGPVVFARPTATPGDGDDDGDRPESGISLDIIDYDDAGDVSFAGDAPAGSTVQLYLDNTVLGVTEAAPSGAWQLAPTQTVPPGPHQIRVDQIAPTGDVVARIELPFVRAEPVTAMPEDTVVIVQPGNSLWRIARQVYGDGIRYTEIYSLNKAQIADPNLIYPGQVFIIPRG